ncbi:TPA: hypothetical protein DCE37_11965 [Candidatus Latescibacteria bacterium]|nr:hypothetical protein [Candidatus Latescibacterota bacterium]
MKKLTHPTVWAILFIALATACGKSTPTGVENEDVSGTWSGTFSEFSLMGRSLSGDGDWTFTQDTFEIIFFNPPEGQAERISGDWKFADGRIALKLTSSFPIDSDIGATDTLFVSILRDEMSLKTITESSILLVKTRLASGDAENLMESSFRVSEAVHLSRHDTPSILDRRFRRANLRIQPSTQHLPT